MAKNDLHVAAVTARIVYEGHPQFIRKGVTTVREGSKFYKQFASLFKPVEVAHEDVVVEQATAAPGEKRTVTRKSDDD